jgi:hypothetical protein
MRLEHGGARARRDNDVVEALEGLDHLTRNRLGVGAVAGIIGGLASTGLALRHLDLGAGVFEQLDRTKADAGPE